MNTEAREFIKRHVLVLLESDPDMTPAQVKEHLLQQTVYDLGLVHPNTLFSFVIRNCQKFSETGSLDRKAGSGGLNATPRDTVNRVKRLCKNKKRRSIRKVGAIVGLSNTTTWRVLRKAGLKPLHKRKVQAMKPEHKVRRVQFATWALREYVRQVHGNTVWGRIINTDFSAMVKMSGNLNTKNDVVWSKSVASAGDLLDFPQEKFDTSFMIWGGVSWKGLIPSAAPVFVCDLKDEWRRMGEPLGRGVDSRMYVHMVSSKAVPAVSALYGNRAIWQDDPARIHRTPAALEACSVFPSRVPHDIQAPKMADIWPIENVWSIVKQRVMEKEPKGKNQLKLVITKVWKEIDNDKELCRKLMKSIPDRLQAVINVDGNQIRRSDYRGGDREE